MNLIFIFWNASSCGYVQFIIRYTGIFNYQIYNFNALPDPPNSFKASITGLRNLINSGPLFLFKLPPSGLNCLDSMVLCAAFE